MILLRLSLVMSITWVISMHVFIEIREQATYKKANNYITKCQALGSNVVDKFKQKGLRSNQLFYDKIYDAIVKECIKLEILK